MRISRSVWLIAAALGCSAHTKPAAVAPRVAVSARPAPSVASQSAAAPPSAVAPPLAPEQIRQVLNRCAFGARPGDAAALLSAGLEPWLDVQLAPTRAAQPALEAALAPYQSALSPPTALVQSWLGEEWAEDRDGMNLTRRLQPFFADHLKSLVLAELTRHVLSERQIEEVLVDFWANHFNVFAKKGLVRVFAGDYIERAVRPNALGRFGDLLLATARHPAMLLYLDNDQSSAEMPADPARARKRGGLNENYARELLELHTLGTDGGYTQQDVTEVARILTGYGVRRAKDGPLEFQFRRGRHDQGPKIVLGTAFPAGQGQAEGERLLALLAAHPATARQVSRKLCALFVADDAPPSCVEAAVTAYASSDGEIRHVVRAIVRDPSFFAPAQRGAKLKTPLEFVASALRAVGGVPDGSTDLARTLKQLGEPLLEESVPTGYPEAERAWASGSGLLARMSFATALASGRAKGVRLSFEDWRTAGELPELLASLEQRVLGGRASARSREVMLATLSEVKSPEQQRTLALALLLGGPEFQRQ